jgi:hypothetical protein
MHHATKPVSSLRAAFLVVGVAAIATVTGCSSSPSAAPPGESAAGGGSPASGGSGSGGAGTSLGGHPADASGGAGGNASGGGAALGSGGSSAGGEAGSDMGGSTGGSDAGAASDGDPGGSTGPSDPDAGVFAIPPGLTKIFDGTTLTGWDGDNRWTVNATDQAIQGRTGGGNLIKTKMNYGDFRLILTERMVLPGPSTNHLGECFWGGAYAAGNFGFGGCIVFIAPHGSLWDYGGGGGVFNGKGAGMKTDWQQVEILVNASTGQILAAVNGVQTTDYTRKAKGKMSPIGLQSHADHAGDTPGFVEYKDIYVESPPKSMTLLTVKP